MSTGDGPTLSTYLETRLNLLTEEIRKAEADMARFLAERDQRYEERHQASEKARGVSAPRESLDTTLDRIHFYVQYHGLNDRPFQELVMRAYHSHILDLNFTVPSLSPSLTNALQVDTSGTASAAKGTIFVSAAAPKPPALRRARVAFVSKFFGLFEPHGMLLDGVMRYLPRSHFEVLALPVARTDSKPLSPGVSEAADEIHEISLSYAHALQMIASLNVDVLVFADSMSEPMSHFLVHSRFAKVQVLFWGNPITWPRCW